MMKDVSSLACRRNKIRDGYIRLIFTRGVARSALTPEAANPRHPLSS